jgi:hypothetical protein
MHQQAQAVSPHRHPVRAESHSLSGFRKNCRRATVAAVMSLQPRLPTLSPCGPFQQIPLARCGYFSSAFDDAKETPSGISLLLSHRYQAILTTLLYRETSGFQTKVALHMVPHTVE